LVEALEVAIMNPHRCAAAAFTVILAGSVVAWLAGFGSAVIASSGAAPILDRASSLAADAEHSDAPQAAVTGNAASDKAEGAAAGADVTGSLPTLPPESPSVQSPTASKPDFTPGDAGEAATSIEIVDECLVVDICVDRYLWTLYRRAPKEDTIKVEEQRQVTVRKKGKTRTVTRSFTTLVDEDFAWKDPKAAEKASMPMTDYVMTTVNRSPAA
jgi:hypothetical protein